MNDHFSSLNIDFASIASNKKIILSEMRRRAEEKKLREKQKIMAQEIDKQISRRKCFQEHSQKTAIFGVDMKTEELNSKLRVLSDLMVEFSDRYERYLSSKRRDYANLLFIPNVADVLVLLPEPLYSSVYRKDIFGARLWDAIVPSLLSISSDYDKRLRDKCTSLLATARGSAQTPQKEALKALGKKVRKLLNLAWAFFLCDAEQCSFFGSYRDICSHEHKDVAWPTNGPKPRPKFFHLINLLRSPDALLQVTCILVTNLKIPLKTRMVDLDNLGRVFTCLRCRAPSATKMTWKDLVSYL